MTSWHFKEKATKIDVARVYREAKQENPNPIVVIECDNDGKTVPNSSEFILMNKKNFRLIERDVTKAYNTVHVDDLKSLNLHFIDGVLYLNGLSVLPPSSGKYVLVLVPGAEVHATAKKFRDLIDFRRKVNVKVSVL